MPVKEVYVLTSLERMCLSRHLPCVWWRGRGCVRGCQPRCEEPRGWREQRVERRENGEGVVMCSIEYVFVGVGWGWINCVLVVGYDQDTERSHSRLVMVPLP